jgi:peptide/nickel transport system permease protein
MTLWRRFKNHKGALAALVIIFILALLSLCAPLIEYSLGVSHMRAKLSETHKPASWPHLLGTNEVGQDVFTRLIFGGRISLSVALIAALSSAFIGTFIGLISGFYGGRLDNILMRFTDAMLSIPVLPLMIVFAAFDLEEFFGIKNNLINIFFICIIISLVFLFFKFISDTSMKRRQKKYFLYLLFNSSYVFLFIFISYIIIFMLIPWKTLGSVSLVSITKLIVIIILFGWMGVARLARAAALQLKNMEYVRAAYGLGATNKRIILAHILPNAMAPIIVATTLEIGINILYEASLSFLGLGIQPPLSSWGNMLNNAVEYIKTSATLAFWPGFFIFVTVASFNFLGDGLRDALDPHQSLRR